MTKYFPLIFVLMAFWLGRQTAASDPKKKSPAPFGALRAEVLVVGAIIVADARKGPDPELQTRILPGEIVVLRQKQRKGEVLVSEEVRIEPGAISVGEPTGEKLALTSDQIRQINPAGPMRVYVSRKEKREADR